LVRRIEVNYIERHMHKYNRKEGVMNNTSKFLMELLLLVFINVSWANATESIDQQQTVMNNPPLAIGLGSDQKIAQVVTAGTSGVLTEVRFPIACSSGNLVVEIQEVTGGIPNGVVLTSQTILGTELPSPLLPIFRSLAFSTPVSISTGNQFAIVLSSAGGCGLLQGPIGDSYLGGNAFFDARPNPLGTWICLCDFSGPFDIPFQTLVDTAIPVIIDIKPGSFPNSINLRNSGKIPVSILTTETFDATNVDPITVFFGTTGTETAPVHFALEDVDSDGDTDMLLHFATQETGLMCEDTSASLTGETYSGEMVEGADSINTVGCK
jgi:hypothetical protein